MSVNISHKHLPCRGPIDQLRREETHRNKPKTILHVSCEFYLFVLLKIKKEMPSGRGFFSSAGSLVSETLRGRAVAFHFIGFCPSPVPFCSCLPSCSCCLSSCSAINRIHANHPKYPPIRHLSLNQRIHHLREEELFQYLQWRFNLNDDCMFFTGWEFLILIKYWLQSEIEWFSQ